MRLVDGSAEHVDTPAEHVDGLIVGVDGAVGCVSGLSRRVGEPASYVGAVVEYVDGASRRDARLLRCVGCALRGAQCSKAVFSASESVDFTFTMGETG